MMINIIKTVLMLLAFVTVSAPKSRQNIGFDFSEVSGLRRLNPKTPHEARDILFSNLVSFMNILYNPQYQDKEALHRRIADRICESRRSSRDPKFNDKRIDKLVEIYSLEDLIRQLIHPNFLEPLFADSSNKPLDRRSRDSFFYILTKIKENNFTGTKPGVLDGDIWEELKHVFSQLSQYVAQKDREILRTKDATQETVEITETNEGIFRLDAVKKNLEQILCKMAGNYLSCYEERTEWDYPIILDGIKIMPRLFRKAPVSNLSMFLRNLSKICAFVANNPGLTSDELLKLISENLDGKSKDNLGEVSLHHALGLIDHESSVIFAHPLMFIKTSSQNITAPINLFFMKRICQLIPQIQEIDSKPECLPENVWKVINAFFDVIKDILKANPGYVAQLNAAAEAEEETPQNYGDDDCQSVEDWPTCCPGSASSSARAPIAGYGITGWGYPTANQTQHSEGWHNQGWQGYRGIPLFE